MHSPWSSEDAIDVDKFTRYQYVARDVDRGLKAVDILDVIQYDGFDALVLRYGNNQIVSHETSYPFRSPVGPRTSTIHIPSDRTRN
jgi:hypothetical protein